MFSVLPPLHGINLPAWFWHLFCQRLRGCAVLRVPRASISGFLCLLFSEPLSEGEHHHLSFGRGQTACDSSKVMAENPHVNKLLGWFFFCHSLPFMGDTAVLESASRNRDLHVPGNSTCGMAERNMANIFPLLETLCFCRIVLLLDSFPSIFLGTSLISSVRTLDWIPLRMLCSVRGNGVRLGEAWVVGGTMWRGVGRSWGAVMGSSYCVLICGGALPERSPG